MENSGFRSATGQEGEKTTNLAMLQTAAILARKQLFVLLGAALLLLAAPRGAGAAGGEASQGASGSALSVTITLYIQGLTLGTVELSSTVADDTYRSVSRLKTEGLINLVWKQTIQATSSGRIRQDRFQPDVYDAFVVKSDGSNEQTSLTWPENGPPRLFVDPPYMDSVKIEIPVKQQMESLDPVSAMTFLLAGETGGGRSPCGRQVNVFDGRRTYVIALTRQAATTIRMDNGLYSGPGQQCSVTYRQVSGAGQQVLEGKSSLPSAQAVIATLTSKQTGRIYHVPLRLWADTPYGRVAAVATALSLDGKPLNPER
jgi:hypothetical protein